jgi:hypothetical protein
MLPPVGNNVANGGIHQIAVGAVAIQAFVTTEIIVNSVAMIFNAVYHALLKHLCIGNMKIY